jgi:hypothetical protein
MQSVICPIIYIKSGVKKNKIKINTNQAQNYVSQLNIINNIFFLSYIKNNDYNQYFFVS